MTTDDHNDYVDDNDDDGNSNKQQISATSQQTDRIQMITRVLFIIGRSFGDDNNH